jgi:carnitine 3-dehydrogenase
VPERLELKQKVHAAIDAAAPPDALIGSSTSGLLPSDIQTAMTHPERFFVAHPYNPVYLLPLVELVGGKQTSAQTLSRAREVYTALGMKPVTIRKEIDAFVGDRLLEAVWREALWLIKEDVTTVEELDDIMRYSFGMRWAQMGLFQTYRIAGGEAGMRHFIEQFGPTLSLPWTRLMDVPELDEALIDKIATQSDEQAGDLGIRDLERIRDENLVRMMHALALGNDGKGWGAGEHLKQYELQLRERAVGAS